MSFASDLKMFTVKLNARNQEVFTGVVDLLSESIVDGSVVTGAPGQPGDLRDYDPASGLDWSTVYESPSVAVISNADPSARSVEDGISYKYGGVPVTLHSAVGGFHSVKLTRMGFLKVVDTVTRRVVGSDA